ncbi:hypothetical protein A2U01_0030637, partial [Trifolium medium]|nr:hypothetical protein [Trifolium medium]
VGEYEETIGTCIAFSEQSELQFMDAEHFCRRK